MLLSKKVESVERFCLRLADGGNVRRAWKALESGECASGVLDDESLRRCGSRGLVVKKGAGGERFGFIAEAGVASVCAELDTVYCALSCLLLRRPRLC